MPGSACYLAQQVPSQGVCVFPIDGSPWPRPRSKILEDRQYVYQATSDVNGGSITIGYPCSMLEWCAEAHSSWSLPIDVRRVPSTQTAQEVGAEQIKSLAQVRSSCLEAAFGGANYDIVAADGKYGNAGFLRSVKGLRAGIIVRLRCDRVLFHAPAPPMGKRGRPRTHGERFAFKEPATWGTPDEVLELEYPLADRAGYPFPERDFGLDNASVPDQRSGRSVDRADLHCLLDHLPASLDRRRSSATLAEGAAALYPATGTAEHLAGFCTDRQSCSTTENARQSARVAARQAENTETTACGSEKNAGSG